MTPNVETLRSALESLSGNRLRSGLTMVGIIIGVAAVILLVGLGDGMRTEFNTQFSRLANQITVTPASKVGGGGASQRELTDRDVDALSDPRRAPHIASVSPSVAGDVTLAVDQVQARSRMVGATHNYLDLLARKLRAGRWFTDSEVTDKERVAVLGPTSVALLWGSDTPLDAVLDSPIRINHTVFTVVAVLEPNGQNDNAVIVPFGAARAYLVGDSAGKVDQIVVKSTDIDTIGQASREIVDILDARHFIRKATDRDYNVLTYTDVLNKSRQFISFLSMFIVAIAAISLLVGGIGVANIMLVAVTERTREIGIRKAIGASSRVIMRQFLSEAVMLTGTGGLAGVALGIGATFAANEILPGLVADFPGPVLSAPSVMIAFGVSLVIGVLAGSYPALRAARMRPIEAIRTE